VASQHHPPSSFDITTNNDVDLNASTGNFSFSLEHAKKFTAHLQRMDTSELTDRDSARLIERGYLPHSYRDEDSQWIFFINFDKGHCEYRMSPSRKIDKK
jgi:hypothetical protein